MSCIYSLVSIDKSCEEDKYIMAISYDKQVLEKMLKIVKSQYEHLCNFIINNNTQLYKLCKENDKIIIVNKTDINNNSDLRGFNKLTTYGCEQVLLDISGNSYDELVKMEIFKDNISLNTISFDIYYDEGILNA